MTQPGELLPPMKWNAWGDPAAAKPLSEGIRSLLKRAVGLQDSDEAELDAERVQLRPSALSQADQDALEGIVGAGYCRTANRDRLLHAGGKSTLDLLRRKDPGIQDAPDAVLLPGDDDAVAAILRYCSEHRIAVVPFGGGTSVVGGLDPTRDGFGAVVSLDLRRFDRLISLDEVSGQAVLGAGLTGPDPNACSANTVSRSGISPRASSTPPSAALPQRARLARTRPATAGSTTWFAGCGWSRRWARWTWAARPNRPRAPTCVSWRSARRARSASSPRCGCACTGSPKPSRTRRGRFPILRPGRRPCARSPRMPPAPPSFGFPTRPRPGSISPPPRRSVKTRSPAVAWASRCSRAPRNTSKAGTPRPPHCSRPKAARRWAKVRRRPGSAAGSARRICATRCCPRGRSARRWRRPPTGPTFPRSKPLSPKHLPPR